MITTNIRPISNHNYSGNITTQSQHQITTGIMDTDTETDPIFRASPAAGITEQDIQNWNEGAGIDLSSYVTYGYMGQTLSAYVTHDFLSEQAYLTSETDPVFSASPAAGITSEDIENWNAGAGVDLSSYVTYEYLSAQSYLTSVTFPDYSNTYQSKGDYITPDVLVAQSYITPDVLASQAYLTTETDPVFSASPAGSITDVDIANWNAAAGTIDMGAYVTKAQLAAQSYVTSSALAGMAYVTQNDIVFPDYQNTYQAKGNYLTSESDPIFSASPAAGITNEDIENWNAGGAVDLSAYVQKNELAAQSYVTSSTLAGMAYVTQSDIVFPDYSSTYQAAGDYVTKTQLSNQSYVQFSGYTENYKYIRYAGGLSFISNFNQNTYTGAPLTSSVSIETLDSHNKCSAGIQSAISYNGTSYIATTSFLARIAPGANGESTVQLNADYIELIPGKRITIRDRENYSYQFTMQFNPFTGSLGLTNFNGISINYKNTQSYIASYAYVIEKIKDFVVSQAYITPDVLASQAYLTTETDPVFSASPAAGITAQDIQNWDTCAGLDLSSYVTYEYLSAQSYLTSVTFPDYSSTYQAKGDYITPSQLTSQAYVTAAQLYAQAYVTQNNIVFPDYSSTYQAKGDYITPTILSAQSYLTSVTFPDYSNTYQAKGDYVTNTALSNCGYVQIKLVTQSQYVDRQDNILYVITDAPPIS